MRIIFNGHVLWATWGQEDKIIAYYNCDKFSNNQYFPLRNEGK